MDETHRPVLFTSIDLTFVHWGLFSSEPSKQSLTPLQAADISTQAPYLQRKCEFGHLQQTKHIMVTK
jgi:hypothetical protein